jgi:hypothetical protein
MTDQKGQSQDPDARLPDGWSRPIDAFEDLNHEVNRLERELSAWQLRAAGLANALVLAREFLLVVVKPDAAGLDAAALALRAQIRAEMITGVLRVYELLDPAWHGRRSAENASRDPTLITRLLTAGAEGADLSPGDPLAAEAAAALKRFEGLEGATFDAWLAHRGPFREELVWQTCDAWHAGRWAGVQARPATMGHLVTTEWVAAFRLNLERGRATAQHIYDYERSLVMMSAPATSYPQTCIDAFENALAFLNRIGS